MIINLLFKTILDIIYTYYRTISSVLEGLQWTQPDLSALHNLYGYMQYFFHTGTINLVVGLVLTSVPIVLVFAVIRFIYQKIPGVS